MKPTSLSRQNTGLLGIVALLVFPACGPRSSGLIGGVHVLDEGVVVEDRFYAYSAVIGTGPSGGAGSARVTPAPGWFVPMLESGPWVVTYDSTRTMRNVRKSRLNEGTRLPKWLDDRTLRAVNVRTGESLELPNTLDSNDEGIVRLRVKGASLIAEAAARYHIGVSDTATKFYVYLLPSGPWQPLSSSDGRAALNARRVRYSFEDLRSGAIAESFASRPPSRVRWAQAQSFDELALAGLDTGDWGKLTQRRVSDRWETVFTSPAGGEVVVLHENDMGAAQRQGTTFNRQPLK